MLAGLVALAVVVPVVARGGYTSTSRSIFVALAGAALLMALITDEDSARRAARTPLVLVLAALAALSLVSAGWTVAEPAAAARWGLVIAAYAALTVAAAVVADRRGAAFAAAVIVAVAGLAALSALIGAGLRSEPYAQRIYGYWRPGGFFEYAPTLALVQVCALPILLAVMARERLLLAVPAAAGAAAAGATVALSGSRWQVAAAAAVALLTLAAPRATARAPRPVLAAAILLTAAAAAVAHFVAGGWVPRGATGGDAGRLLAFAATLAGAAALWRPLRVVSERRSFPRLSRPVLIAGGALAAAAVVALVSASIETGPRNDRTTSFTHGRADQWRAAVETAGDRPVAGSGADSFLVASAEEQGEAPVRYAHNLPLELTVELGLLGAALAIALFVLTGRLMWLARRARDAWLVLPAVAAFPLTNLADFSWHQAGAGAVWCVAVGAAIALTPVLPQNESAGQEQGRRVTQRSERTTARA